MRIVAGFVLMAALGACSSAPQPAPAPDGEDTLSGVNVEGIAACVSQNATPEEMSLLAAGGEPAQTTTAAILNRESTLTCLSDNNITRPGAPA